MDHEFDNLSADEWLVLNKILRAYRDNLRFGEARWIFLTPMCADERPDTPIVMPHKPRQPKQGTIFRPQASETETPPLSPRVTDNGQSVDLPACATCREAVLAVLTTENRRMTSGEIYQWLVDHDKYKSYTKSTVIKTLSLMQDNGEVNNDKDDCGKGYGLIPQNGRNGIIGT